MDKRASNRQDRLIKERRHDAYRRRTKLQDPTVCTECGALYTTGRWTWQEPPENANKITCPACRRQSEKFPAGVVHLGGGFFYDHREEIMNLVHNVEKLEKNERPMELIMHVEKDNGNTMVTTTGVHVARRIGEALSRAFKGDLSYQYGSEDQSIRVDWQR